MKIQNLVTSILIFSLITPAFADQSTLIEKGTPAPYSGFLLDHEKASKVRLLSIDLQEAVKTRDYLKADNELYVKRLENATQQNDKLAAQVQDLRDTGIWSTIGIFLLGNAAAILAVYGISHVTR